MTLQAEAAYWGGDGDRAPLPIAHPGPASGADTQDSPVREPQVGDDATRVTQHVDGTSMASPNNLGAIASVLMAACDGAMLQWVADPQAAPNANKTLDALAALGALAAMR